MCAPTELNDFIHGFAKPDNRRINKEKRMKKERIDKLIAGSGKLSRKDVAGLISHGNVTLNGRTVKSGSEKADADADEIKVCGEIFTIKNIYT